MLAIAPFGASSSNSPLEGLILNHHLKWWLITWFKHLRLQERRKTAWITVKNFLGQSRSESFFSSLPFPLSSRRSSTCCTISLTGSTLDISREAEVSPWPVSASACRSLWWSPPSRPSSAPAVRRERRSLWEKMTWTLRRRFSAAGFRSSFLRSWQQSYCCLAALCSWLLEPVKTPSTMPLITWVFTLSERSLSRWR